MYFRFPQLLCEIGAKVRPERCSTDLRSHPSPTLFTTIPQPHKLTDCCILYAIITRIFTSLCYEIYHRFSKSALVLVLNIWLSSGERKVCECSIDIFAEKNGTTGDSDIADYFLLVIAQDYRPTLKVSVNLFCRCFRNIF